MYLLDVGDIVATESDVVMLTPVIDLNTAKTLDTTPTPTDTVASVITLNESSFLDVESDMDSD